MSVVRTVILMGAPGSGKGTQARLLQEKLNLPQISTGDILRKIAKHDSPLGLKIRELQTNGNYVPDDIMVELVRNRILETDCKNGYVLDGFPRTIYQVEVLNRLVEQQGNSLYVIEIAVPREVLVKRLAGRRTCVFCGYIYNIYFLPTKEPDVCDSCGGRNFIHRADDSEMIVHSRQDVYELKTVPLIAYYREKSKVYTLDGTCDVDIIFHNIQSILDIE